MGYKTDSILFKYLLMYHYYKNFLNDPIGFLSSLNKKNTGREAEERERD